MTTPSQTLNLLQLLFGLSVLLLLFCGPWRQFVLDAVRQYLFQVRDRAFLLAADGKIAFDDPIYLEFRATINTRIRHLHEFSIYNILFASTSDKAADTLLNRIRSVENRDVRYVLEKSYAEMLAVMLVCTVLRSLLFTILLVPAAMFAAVVVIIDGPADLWRFSRKARNAVAAIN